MDFIRQNGEKIDTPPVTVRTPHITFNALISFRSDDVSTSRRIELSDDDIDEQDCFDFSVSDSAYGTLATNAERALYNFYNDIHAY